MTQTNTIKKTERYTKLSPSHRKKRQNKCKYRLVKTGWTLNHQQYHVILFILHGVLTKKHKIGGKYFLFTDWLVSFVINTIQIVYNNNTAHVFEKRTPFCNTLFIHELKLMIDFILTPVPDLCTLIYLNKYSRCMARWI